jgi:ATP-dependent Clp protease adaptor protein ClpS
MAREQRTPVRVVAEETKTHTDTETDALTRLEFGWNVVVWDDPINLMTYVVYVFRKLFGFSEPEATKHMLEVHNEGKSLVATAHREKAEHYVTRLHAYGLQATLQRATES